MAPLPPPLGAPLLLACRPPTSVSGKFCRPGGLIGRLLQRFYFSKCGFEATWGVTRGNNSEHCWTSRLYRGNVNNRCACGEGSSTRVYARVSLRRRGVQIGIFIYVFLREGRGRAGTTLQGCSECTQTLGPQPGFSPGGSCDACWWWFFKFIYYHWVGFSLSLPQKEC